jgi:hypothetical protein
MPGSLHRVAHGPSAATVERLDRLDRMSPRVAVTRYVAAATGIGWLAVDRLRAAPELDAWYLAELDGPARGHRDVAGSLVAYRVAEVLADLTVGTLVRDGRVLMPSPSQVALRLGAGPRVEAVAVASHAVAVLPDDVDAGAPGTVTVRDVPSLLAAAAETLVEVFRPVTRAVRARAPYGLRGMWGTLADHLAEAALRRAAPRPGDQEAAWALADALVEHVADHQPLLCGRPRPQWVTGAAGTSLFAAKGTCCLIYKAHRPRPGQGLGSRALIEAGACATCPLLTAGDRRDRLVALVEREREPAPEVVVSTTTSGARTVAQSSASSW